MKKKILALVDFSPYSATLATAAYHWSHELKTEIVLVHEIPTLIPAMADTATSREIIAQEKDHTMYKLQELAKSANPMSRPTQYHVTEKSVTRAIAELAEADTTQLIFVGLKGTNFLKRLVVGSVATKVIEESSSVIVALPKQLNALSVGRLAIAVNQKFPVNQEALRSFLNFVGPMVHEMLFFSIITPEDMLSLEENSQYLQQLSDNFQDHAPCAIMQFKGEAPFQDIKTYAADANFGTLVLQRGSRAFADQILRKFFIDELVHDGSIPLIVLP